MTTLSLDIALELGEFRLAVAEELTLSGVTALFGPSGSGKTSLLRVISGLEARAAGTVRFAEHCWQGNGKSTPVHQRRLGFVFQDGRLFPHLTVEDNLRFPKPQSHATGAIAFDEVLAALDLQPLLPRRPATLSGGERQRVAIGRALLANPQLLLMDEPVSSLDTDRRREVVNYIAKLPTQFNLPVIYVTHDITELVRLADTVVMLAGGRVVGRGSPRAILERDDLTNLLGLRDAGSLLEAEVRRHSERMTELTIGTETIKVPRIDADVGSNARLRIQARDVVVACERPNRLSIRNVLRAQIVSIDTRHATQGDVLLTIGDQSLRARITRDAIDELGLAPQQQVFALIKSVALDEDSM